MDLHRRQSQFELFPSTSESSAQAKSSGYQFKDLTLSLENIIVLSIILVMVLVLSFSFGVEKGKNYYQVERSKPSHDAIVQSKPDVKQRFSVDSQVVTNNEPVTASGKVLVQPVSTPPVADVTAGVQNLKGLTDKPKETPARNLKEELIGQYTIQVASFKNKERAIQEAQKLTTKGHKIYVVPKGEHSIVCIGSFDQKKEAEKLLNKFKNKYGDSLVRRF